MIKRENCTFENSIFQYYILLLWCLCLFVQQWCLRRRGYRSLYLTFMRRKSPCSVDVHFFCFCRCYCDCCVGKLCPLTNQRKKTWGVRMSHIRSQAEVVAELNSKKVQVYVILHQLSHTVMSYLVDNMLLPYKHTFCLSASKVF